jgi:hypothetical protein
MDVIRSHEDRSAVNDDDRTERRSRPDRAGANLAKILPPRAVKKNGATTTDATGVRGVSPARREPVTHIIVSASRFVPPFFGCEATFGRRYAPLRAMKPVSGSFRSNSRVRSATILGFVWQRM